MSIFGEAEPVLLDQVRSFLDDLRRVVRRLRTSTSPWFSWGHRTTGAPSLTSTADQVSKRRRRGGV